MLTPEDQRIFDECRRTSNLDTFTEFYFRLPWSGTWFTPEDRPERYEMLYDSWAAAGRPSDQFTAVLDEQPIELKIMWDAYYGDYPMILLPHGFRSLDWLRELVSPQNSLAIAVTGSGSGKTSGVAIAALTYCALYPGFRFLNVAPTTAQAALMLGEIEKWCSNTKFAKFIKTPSRSTHKLWVSRPHPTITVEVYSGYPSTFVCQTVGRDASGIIGGEQDWISCDESQLLANIDTARPIFVTRLRGTRATGILRWGKLTWITNPGRNPELVALMEEYRELIEKGHEDVLVLEGIESSVNIYVTARQLEKQRRTMTAQIVDRWHGGLMSAAFAGTGIDEALLDQCRSTKLDVQVEELGQFDGFGVRRYAVPYQHGHDYVVFGDAGKCDLASMSSQNIPVVGVFDVTDFLEQPSELVSFHWLDGLGSYSTFVACMKQEMLRYRAQGFYDATNIQTAFEDLGRGGFADWPTVPIFFGGSVSTKGWALIIFTQLMQEGLLAWPYIKGLWHQARVWDPGSTKKPDDIIAALLVFCLALKVENVFWHRLVSRFGWGEEDESTEAYDETEGTALVDDRYARLVADR